MNQADPKPPFRIWITRRLVLLLSLLLLPPPSRAEDWPQWLGPNRNGVWNDTGVLDHIPAEGLKIRWRTPVGPGYSSPVVADGRVYITDAELNRPRATERIHCLDETTGKPLWSHSYAVAYPDYAFDPPPGMGPVATPIISGGRVYTVGSLGQLCCLDAVKGQVVWERALDKEYQAKEFNLNSSPLIEGDLLIVFLGGKEGAGGVVAFNKHSGKEAWRALEEASTNSTPAVIVMDGKRQVIVWTQESVTSLDPLTGKTNWRMPLRTSRDMAISTPVCSQELLLIGGLMLKLNDGPKPAVTLWPETKAVTQRVLSNTSTAMIRGDHVFSARSSGQLVCLEAKTGKQVWETDKVTDIKGGASIHLTPNGDRVFLYTDRGELIRARLNAEEYKEMGRARLLEPTYPFSGRKVAWSPPAYANRHVFARSDKELVCASLEAEK